jgi:hypothetical protein
VKSTSITVPASRVIDGAKVKCVQKTCRIKKIEVRYNIGNKVYNGVGTAQLSIKPGKTVTVRTTMPERLYKKLKPGKVTGTVTISVTVTSENGTRVTSSVRTGLKR